MTALLSRYLLRETLQTWLVVTLVLLLILLTNQFATVVGDAAAGKLPRDAVFLLMGLTSIQYLTILVPFGLFLAVMLSLGRLYHDSEMAAMMACGIGPSQLYRPLLLLAACLGLTVGLLALVAAPGAVREVTAMAAEARRDASLGLLQAGRFVTFGDTGAVLYAGDVTPDGRLRDVFVQRRVADGIELILAEEAWQVEGADPGVRMLTFARGHRYEGQPGDLRFRIVDFAEHGIPVTVPEARPASRKPAAKASRELLASTDLEDRAELHWRVAVPATLLVLVILAVPLAKTEPRRGRFSGIAAAVLAYVVYVNLLAAGRGWLERGQVPEALGLWWVHALFLVAAVLMLGWHYGTVGIRLRRLRAGLPRPFRRRP